MNQNAKRIAEGELGQAMKNYCKTKEEDEKMAETYKEKVKEMLFDLWLNGDITISFN